MPGTGLPVVGGVADAAGEEDEFFGVGWGEHEVFGVAADHAESVDQHADEEIGLPEMVTVHSGHDPVFDQCGERLHCVRRPQHRQLVSVQELQVLNGIFDIDQAAGAELHVDRARFHQLLKLLSSQVQCDRQVPWLTAVDKFVPVGLDLFAERGVACDEAELDQ